MADPAARNAPRSASTGHHGRSDTTELGGAVCRNAIEVGGVDLADPATYEEAMRYDAFRRLRQKAPVCWHPYVDDPGFLAVTGYDEVQAVSRDSVTWSSQATGV